MNPANTKSLSFAVLANKNYCLPGPNISGASRNLGQFLWNWLWPFPVPRLRTEPLIYCLRGAGKNDQRDENEATIQLDESCDKRRTIGLHFQTAQARAYAKPR